MENILLMTKNNMKDYFLRDQHIVLYQTVEMINTVEFVETYIL